MIADAASLSPVHIDDLREADTGELHGLTGVEMREQYPEFMKLWQKDAGTARMPGGESLIEVQNRAWDAVTRLHQQHSNETIVAVSHNFTILTIICEVLDMPLNNFRRLKQGLCAITRIEMTDERHVLLSLNETAHLRESCNE
jgi:broad specificity phosphatase PhoE